MKRNFCISAFRCAHPLLVLLFALAATAPCATRGQPSAAAPDSLVVVSDDNYPPYIFADASGSVRGIIPDLWTLWQQKTGIKVQLRAMPWTDALRVMHEGHADVIDAIFQTEERRAQFFFTAPYAKIEVPVYVHKALGGISDIPSLQGLTIGVKTGDAVIEYLKSRGIDSIKEYPSYETIILAAKKQELKVFSVDEPAAVYFLYKHGLSSQFRRSFVLYTGAFHRAVAKNRPDLLSLVEEGFARISPRDYLAIEHKWKGVPFPFLDQLRPWAPWGLAALAAVVALVLWNVLLARRVKARTAELNKALDDLRSSLAEREHFEKELESSGQYLATVFDSINEALFIHEAESGRIIDVNRRMCEMYGFSTREEALAGGLAALCTDIPPYTLADAQNWMRKACDEGPQIFEWQARHHDGHLFWVEVNIRQVKIGAINRLIVSVRDITERKQTQAELRANHEMLQMFMRNSPIYAFIKEVTATESRTLFASENYEQMIGIPGSQMRGKTMQELFPAEFAAKISADDWDVVTHGQVLKLDENLNGRFYTTIKFPIIQAQKTLLAGYTIDITDLKNTEQALASALERYNLLAKHSRIVTWTIDMQGLYTDLSAEVSNVCGYAPADLKDRRYFFELHPEKGREEFRSKVFEIIAKGDPIQNLVHPVVTASGDTAWVSSSGIPTRDVQGQIVGYWGTSTDITDLKRAEEEKAALQEQLMHAQKLESVGRLAGGVAHDFNNMLQAILGYTEMALEEVPGDTSLHEDLSEIHKAAQRSANLTRQLQTFARKQPVSPRPLDINAAVDGMSGMLRRIIGESIHLEWKPGKGLGRVIMDPGQFDHLVVNICINARDAIGKAGTISIETCRCTLSSAQARRFVGISPGEYVLLSIRDDGTGMTPEVRDQIFEPFFTTKPIGQGTGLGLAIVYGIVKQNGGHILVESEPGKGSVFQIYLPRYTGDPEQAEPEAEPDSSTTPAKGTILLVDDEDSILRPTRQILEHLGYQVLATTSPKDAIALFEAQPDRIDLVISDVIMPDINGPEMIKVMQVLRPKLKHLFISGHTANLLAGQGLHEDAPYIQKPFSRKALAQKVHEALSAS